MIALMIISALWGDTFPGLQHRRRPLGSPRQVQSLLQGGEEIIIVIIIITSIIIIIIIVITIINIIIKIMIPG